MTKTFIATPDYRLPVTETRLLCRMLFEDGWIEPKSLAKLLPLWTLDASDAEVKTLVDEIVVPAWLESNARFGTVADELSAKLGRPLTEDERLSLKFPTGPYSAEAQNIIQSWFENTLKDSSALLN